MVIQEKENPNDSNERTIRAFTNASRRLGTMRQVKSRQFFERKANGRKMKENALRRKKSKEEYDFGVKIGKIIPRRGRFGRP